jgi:hypothetical protein
LSVDADHDRVVADVVVPEAVRPAGVDGAVVSPPPPDVVTLTYELAADRLPAASYARTANVYAVEADRPDAV